MATNTHGLKMRGLTFVSDLTKRVQKHDRPCAVVTVYDREKGAFRSEVHTIAELEDRTAPCHTYANSRYISVVLIGPHKPQEIADLVANQAGMDDALSYLCEHDVPYPSPESTPYRGGIKDVEPAAYGDWITYEDGTTEYRSIGE